jgi:ATP-dependent Zn protease
MTKRRKEQTIQWSKEEKNKQYNGQKKKRTDNTMAKRRKEQTIQWPKEEKNRQLLFVLFFFWPLYCLFFPSFGHCIVCSFLLLAIVLFVLSFFWPLKEQTIQWPKEEKNKQYNGQKKERTNNTMAKRRKEQTIQWPKEEKNKQYNDCIVCSFLLLVIVLFVLFFFWPLYCLFFSSFGHCIV